MTAQKTFTPAFKLEIAKLMVDGNYNANSELAERMPAQSRIMEAVPQQPERGRRWTGNYN
jgi:hypothetical protein